MSKPTIVSQKPDMTGTPIYYVDQPASIALGPHICRMTFGVEEDDDSDFPRPIVTIAMPTTSLLMMVNDLVHTLNSQEFKKDAALKLAESVKKLSAGITASPSSELVKKQKSRRPKALPSE